VPGSEAGAMSALTVADGCDLLAERERPKYALLRALAALGVYRVAHLGRIRAPGGTDPFQRLAVEALTRDAVLEQRGGWRGRIIHREQYQGKTFEFMAGRGDEEPDAVVVPGRGLRERVLAELPPRPRPVIALDFSLIHRHSPEEARSLRVQVGAALGAVRRYLWDPHLLLAGLERGVLEWLRGFLASPYVATTMLPADEGLTLRGYRRIILLDPSAEKPLTGREAKEADAFILGAIVDRTPRPGETSRLRLRGLYTPRRLELRGSTHGVPNRINTLAEILLRARYETCGNIEKAILASMSPRDARARAYVEISRWLRGRTTKVPWELYCRLRSWLPLTPRDFRRAARMAGAEVEPGEPHCENTDHRRRG